MGISKSTQVQLTCENVLNMQATFTTKFEIADLIFVINIYRDYKFRSIISVSEKRNLGYWQHYSLLTLNPLIMFLKKRRKLNSFLLKMEESILNEI